MVATYFVIERTATGEQAALYYDDLPRRYLGQKAQWNGLIYKLRLDTLPDASGWLAMSLPQLYEVYEHLRRRNKLPAAVAS